MLSIKEILDEIKAFEDRNTEKAQLLYSVAHKNAQWNAFAFNSPKEMPALIDEFPLLFSGLQPTAQKGARKMEQWELDKLRFSIYANAHNSSIKKEGGHDHE